MIFKQNKFAASTGKVYQYLFGEIIYGRLKPGTALSEVEIADKLTISRTPVREALMKLESDGLVVRYPSRGCFVSEITVHDVEEIFELRIQLEICALRNSYRRISEKEFENLEAKLEALTQETAMDEYYETDRELHSLILNYCGNNRLIDFLGILNAQIERLRVISASNPRRLGSSRSEHLDIVKAMRAYDLPLAEKLLAAHIGNVRDSTIEVCKYMHTVPVPAAREQLEQRQLVREIGIR